MILPLFGKQEVGIWRVQKRFPRYGVPIWSLWPNGVYNNSLHIDMSVHLYTLSRLHANTTPRWFFKKWKAIVSNTSSKIRYFHFFLLNAWWSWMTNLYDVIQTWKAFVLVHPYKLNNTININVLVYCSQIFLRKQKTTPTVPTFLCTIYKLRTSN